MIRRSQKPLRNKALIAAGVLCAIAAAIIWVHARREKPAAATEIVMPSRQSALQARLRDLQTSDSETQARELREIAQSSKNPAELIESTTTSAATPLVAELRRRLAREAGLRDSANALEPFLASKAPDHEILFEQAILGWSEHDSEAALQWAIAKLPEGALKNRAIVSTAIDLARRAPGTALREMMKLPPSPDRARVTSFALQQWTATDSAAAVEWARALPDVASRDVLLGNAMVAWAAMDGPAAADALTQIFPEGDGQARAGGRIAQLWAQQEPTAAASWVETLPEGATRTFATENLIAEWARTDSGAGASIWASAIRDPQLRDLAYSYLAQSLRNRDSVQALRLAGQISDPTLRERCLAQLAQAR